MSARMAELVDAAALEAVGLEAVEVRILLGALWFCRS